jgi:SAM-dependent methyltransferase
MPAKTVLARCAGSFAGSVVFRRSRRLWDENRKNWHLPLSKWDKVTLGIYLILSDYSKGLFPPSFKDQQSVHEAEVAYRFSLPGVSASDVAEMEMRKPFRGDAMVGYLDNFIWVSRCLRKCGVAPPQRLLELGCGNGWMTEWLALMRFDVVGTSLSPHDIEDAKKRIAGLEARGIHAALEFRVSPMESVAENLKDRSQFDGVFVFEALHHAYDWRTASESAHACLRPGGWFFLFNEPNWLHTCASYRVARLSNTHEVGFARPELLRHLRRAGYRRIVVLRHRWHFGVRPHWIAAQK